MLSRMISMHPTNGYSNTKLQLHGNYWGLAVQASWFNETVL